MLPKFIVIGAQKAGTTSLFHYLADHPQVYLHPIKEINYFAWPDTMRSLRRYVRYFAKAPRGAVCGDVSTDYAKYPNIQHVPERMWKLLPDAKLIYLVRHPVRRAISHYHHKLLQGVRGMAPIDEELRAGHDYTDFGRYYMQLEQYLKYFDSRQIQVVVFEEWLADKANTMSRIFRHIGCDASYTPTNLDLRANAADASVQLTRLVHLLSRMPGYQSVRFKIPSSVRRFAVRALSRRRPELPWPSPETVDCLAAQFEQDVEALTSYLGRRRSPWELSNWDTRHPSAGNSGGPANNTGFATAATVLANTERGTA